MLTGTVVLVGTAAEPPDRGSTVPEISTPLTSRPLAAASESGLRPAREAIPVSVSPGWTTYAPALLAGAADAVDATSSASLSPSPIEDATPVAVEVAPDELATAVPDPCGGICSADPATSCVVGDSPLAAASASTVRPSAAAIENS